VKKKDGNAKRVSFDMRAVLSYDNLLKSYLNINRLVLERTRCRIFFGTYFDAVRRFHRNTI
jgi:hypothetical protein